MQWKHSVSPAQKKFKVTPSAGKVMLTVFWDCQGVLLTEFQQRDHTVTSASYCTLLTKLRAAFAGSDQASTLKGCCCCMTTPVHIVPIRPQRHWSHWSGKSSYIHLTARISPRAISACLALKLLSGEHFPDDAVERAVCDWFWQQPQEFYAAGFQGLVKPWDKCLNFCGDYVQKWTFVCHYPHSFLVNRVLLLSYWLTLVYWSANPWYLYLPYKQFTSTPYLFHSDKFIKPCFFYSMGQNIR